MGASLDVTVRHQRAQDVLADARPLQTCHPPANGPRLGVARHGGERSIEDEVAERWTVDDDELAPLVADDSPLDQQVCQEGSCECRAGCHAVDARLPGLRLTDE